MNQWELEYKGRLRLNYRKLEFSEPELDVFCNSMFFEIIEVMIRTIPFKAGCIWNETDS